jgi:hypothetical protein
MDFLLDQFESAKKEYGQSEDGTRIADEYMLPCINAGWATMDEYYGLTDRSPVYIAACILVPSQKWTYFDDNWLEDWVTSGKATVKALWENHYKATAPSILMPPPKSTKPLSKFEQWTRDKKRPSVEKDEYLLYCSADIMPDCDALKWWMEPAQRTTYPNLSKMALDILSIPAMSAEPERLFSGCKITITDRRNRLGIESIESLECLKSWLCKGSVAWMDEEDR